MAIQVLSAVGAAPPATLFSPLAGPPSTKRPNKFLTILSGLLSHAATTLSLSGLAIHTCPREAAMSFTVFLAISILGCDFLLYVLFQWVYGEKRRKVSRRRPASTQQPFTLAHRAAKKSNIFSFPQPPTRHRTGFF
jgi:hypothetical protein